MYRVLIADDEQRIRRGLKNIVNWGKLGYMISGEAANGEETLQFLINNNPDVVLLDISMPKLSGLDAINIARQNGFNGKVIILSSYSEFKFAQEAIKLEVKYYLLKPIDENELERILMSLRKQFDDESKSRINTKYYIERAKETVLRDLLLNSSNTAVDMVDMNIEATKYQVVLYKSYDSQRRGQRYPFDKLLNINNIDNQMFESIEINDIQAILLKGNDVIERFGEFVFKSIYGVSLQDRTTLTSIFLAYGRSVDAINDIHLSYEDAEFLMSRRFFCEQDQCIMGYEQFSQFDESKVILNDELLKKYCNEFTKYIQSFNRSMIAENFNRLEEQLFNANCNLNDIRYFLTDMYLTIKENISRIYDTITIPFPTNSWVMDFIQSRVYLYEIIQFFSEQFKLIMNCIGNYSKDSILDDILYYIDHNYMNNIKLENIAPLFGYNCSYLGRIIKEKTHQSFNAYLDRVRIEKAKKLLNLQTLKVYEIAEKVGYANADYFYMKFKNLVGMSPTEYRKQSVES